MRPNAETGGPIADIEATDKSLIRFYTRACNQGLIVTGSQDFVQGSRLQEVKSISADLSKNDNIIRSLESRQELGLQVSPGTGNRIEKLCVKLRLFPFCKISLSECVASLVGFHFIFPSLHRLPSFASHIVAKGALEMSSTKNNRGPVLSF